MCFSATIINTLRGIPKNERLEIVFEQQTVHQKNNVIALQVIADLRDSEILLEDGRSKLASWRSVPKGATVLTELADYFAYALFQSWRDSSSLKSSLCKPVLDAYGGEGLGAVVNRETIRQVVVDGEMMRLLEEARRSMEGTHAGTKSTQILRRARS